MNETSSVFETYEDQADLQSAVVLLKSQGFKDADISAIMKHDDIKHETPQEKKTEATEGVLAGVSTGAITGGVFGLLMGLGTIAIPGVGMFIAVGPILSALGGIGAGMGVGGLLGEIGGVLTRMGSSEHEAKTYEGLVHEGKLLLSIHNSTPEAVIKAKAILKETHATNISN